ncbi:LysM peptidoglycan-binding domain-containing protein [Thermanaerovibrio acidaminovorans]|jgi:nucleoid-associated protein YgaU|uniref:LysM peptidoglycan-binding domain-containing protein n=1 Tax=Thermanaerovibrio acidaminovorans TaxID=81462 RepID=UPI00248FD57D|nr:LysM peptidoglycan-binding domain-containing protein [Thermanaerovibrio acidaminovorans]
MAIQHRRHHGAPKLEGFPGASGAKAVLEGYQRVEAIAALVESVIIWRAQWLVRCGNMLEAEEILFRLIYKEGSTNPQAMDLLARIYFHKGQDQKAVELWRRAAELQPGNFALKRTLSLAKSIEEGKRSVILAAYRMGLAVKSLMAVGGVAVLLVALSLGAKGIERWLQGPEPTPLEAHYYYDISKLSEPVKGTYTLGFTRVRQGTSASRGRVEVLVEQDGDSVRAYGKVPSLLTRYQVEMALYAMEGIKNVDLRGLQVERSYTVQRGDSLWLISRRLYGEGQAWTVLSRHNGLSDPSRLKVGQVLNLPLGDEELVPDR